MADNELNVVIADGSTKGLRSRESTTGRQSQMVDVSPWVPTTVDSAQYSVDVTTGTVVTLTVPATATHALLTIEDANVRFTENGDTPTTGAGGNGMFLQFPFIGELAVPVGESLKFIAVTATAQLNVSYRKYV